ncbi:uncharacterized protein A1O9_05040 [Exophiala aquamarina CBS 119918]|uniref:Uncharacterized protein n=1 Tax=Exophiala aquamarina CBS 119918 TaxID=1182545 RepID=A0A072PX67_9EURO|nr:uncharacterized protein A1O9_05040 [Exophiala aquamarina CBS 119918]KEF60190.1 hypothetical protein A1O9_05040 [Exophiala aquamarina CBS 119918]
MSDIPESPRDIPIYSTIRAFNVVPQNSEIIQCVTVNDLKGVRRLIEQKKASPRDVDPEGTSLLSYAIYSGCTEIFRLLLEGGASTDQRRVHEIPPVDVITM